MRWRTDQIPQLRTSPHQTPPALPWRYWARPVLLAYGAATGIIQGHPGRPDMTTRTNKSGIFTRKMAAIATVMGLISFALGYLIHPM